jgi:transposase
MHPLSSTQISHITELVISGLSFRQVHRKNGVGLATISRICSKYLPNLEKSCGGHPAKLSAADIDYTKLNMQRNKIKTAVQAAKVLQNANGESISAKTICRGLKKSGWRARRKVKRPALEKRHIKARLEFAERHLEWTVDDWKRVWWSDETKINRFGSDGNEMVWGEKGMGLNERCVKETRKFGGGSIIVWGCMSWEGLDLLPKLMVR